MEQARGEAARAEAQLQQCLVDDGTGGTSGNAETSIGALEQERMELFARLDQYEQERIAIAK